MQGEGLMCWNCGKPTGLTGGVTRDDSCPNCLADLRCCHGCRHYEPTRRFQCRENVETGIPRKEKANFCDYFQVRNVYKTKGGITTQTDSKENRKKKFDGLFND